MCHKKKYSFLSFFLVLILCLMFTACGGQENSAGDSDAIVGTWEMTEITAGSSQVSAAEYMKAANVSKVPVLTFEGSGKVTLELDGDSGSGTWSNENGAYSISYGSGEDETVKALDVNGSRLVMEQDGYTLTYEKR